MKKVTVLLLTLVVCWYFQLPCLGLTGSDFDRIGSSKSQEGQQTAAQEQHEFLQEQLDAIGDSLQKNLPPEAADSLESMGLSDLNFREILSLTPQKFFSAVKNAAVNAWKEPARTIGKLLGVLLLCSLLYALKGSMFRDGIDSLFSTAAVLFIVSIVSGPITECVLKVMESLQHCSVFILSYIPVLSGILTANGQPAAATGYHLMLFGACQAASQLSVSTLTPLLGIYFAFSILAGIFPQMGLQSLAAGLKSVVCWGLGLITTAFVGLLSLQTLVSSSVDSLTVKTSKFLMGSFIPVVGSVISDAFAAAQGCFVLLKNAVGTVGILVAVGTFLPALIQVTLWYLVAWSGAQAGNMLQVKEASSVLKGASDTLAILLALVVCFALLMIVSTTLVMILGMGR